MKLEKYGHPDENIPTTGSPHPGEPVFLVVGKLQRSHGLHGELIMDVVTDFPERLVAGKKVYVGERRTEQTVRSVRARNRGLLIAFVGIDTPEAASLLRNQLIYVPADELPNLPDGNYYHHQLLDLEVVDESGAVLGHLNEIIETGANDVYVITTPAGGEMLLPATPEVILSVDLVAKQIRVKPPEWE